jgi:hypothetical protein
VHMKKSKTDPSQEMMIHGKIIHELHEMLREAQDDVVIGTGADRGQRWTDNHTPAPGGRNGVINGFVVPEAVVGNAANAALAAVAVANKVSTFVVIYHEVFQLNASLIRQLHVKSAFLPPLVCQTLPNSVKLKSVHYGHFRLVTMGSS